MHLLPARGGAGDFIIPVSEMPRLPETVIKASSPSAATLSSIEIPCIPLDLVKRIFSYHSPENLSGTSKGLIGSCIEWPTLGVMTKLVGY